MFLQFLQDYGLMSDEEVYIQAVKCINWLISL